MKNQFSLQKKRYYGLFHSLREIFSLSSGLAEQEPEVVEFLKNRMLAHIAKREAEVGHANPMYTNLNWSGFGRPFESSEEAYNNLHIGDPEAAQKLQAKLKEMGVEG